MTESEIAMKALICVITVAQDHPEFQLPWAELVSHFAAQAVRLDARADEPKHDVTLK